MGRRMGDEITRKETRTFLIDSGLAREREREKRYFQLNETEKGKRGGKTEEPGGEEEKRRHVGATRIGMWHPKIRPETEWPLDEIKKR